MFRRKLLEKQSDPDALDQLLVVVTPRSVLAALGLAGVVATAVAWSIMAELPVVVDGQGILLKPGYVTKQGALSEGRIESITIEPGDRIKAGVTLATISQPSLERELDRLNAQFDIRRAFAQRQRELATRTRELERTLAAENRLEIEQQIASLTELKDSSEKMRDAALQERRANLGRIEELLERQKDEQQTRMDGVSRLAQRGMVNNQARLSALSAVTSSAIETARIELQMSDTKLSEISALQEQLQLIRDIQNARSDLTRIDIQENQAERGFQEMLRAEEETIEEMAAQIRSARQEIARAKRISSPFEAIVLERLVDEGDLVAIGMPVAMVRLVPQAPFVHVSLSKDAEVGTFRIAVNGTQSPDIPVYATGADITGILSAMPELAGWTVKGTGRLADGGVDLNLTGPEGKTLSDLNFEMRDRDLWSSDGRPAVGSLTILGVHAPDLPLEHVGFFPIGLAKKIKPGLEIRIDPSSVERDRFGSLVGTVTSVSDFAITEEGMMQVVGNSQIAMSLVGAGGGVIMIEASLNADPEDRTGYEWTSKSPDFDISEGTTTTARVVVEMRRPITFVIPLLRSWILGEGKTPTVAQAIQGMGG